MTNKTEHKRLQFDFSIGALEKLDELVKQTDSVSRAEVVRDSLRFYELLVSWARKGYKFQILKDDDEKEKYIVPFPL